MNTETFEILPMEEVKKKTASVQAKFKQIPEGYEHILQRMNRKQRRKWYRENKKLFST